MNETNIPTHEFHTQSGESPAHMACSSYSVSLSLPVCYRYSNECYCRSEWEKGRKLWFGPRQVRDILIKCAVCVCEGGSVLFIRNLSLPKTLLIHGILWESRQTTTTKKTFCILFIFLAHLNENGHVVFCYFFFSSMFVCVIFASAGTAAIIA